MDNNEAREILIDFHTNRQIKYDTDPNHTYNELLTQAIDCAIQALGDGWVSVDERLPESGQNILMYHNSYGIGIGYYIPIDGSFGGTYHGIANISYKADIIAWQPLPSPPKPKQP